MTASHCAVPGGRSPRSAPTSCERRSSTGHRGHRRAARHHGRARPGGRRLHGGAPRPRCRRGAGEDARARHRLRTRTGRTPGTRSSTTPPRAAMRSRTSARHLRQLRHSILDKTAYEVAQAVRQEHGDDDRQVAEMKHGVADQRRSRRCGVPGHVLDRHRHQQGAQSLRRQGTRIRPRCSGRRGAPRASSAAESSPPRGRRLGLGRQGARHARAGRGGHQPQGRRRTRWCAPSQLDQRPDSRASPAVARSGRMAAMVARQAPPRRAYEVGTAASTRGPSIVRRASPRLHAAGSYRHSMGSRSTLDDGASPPRPRSLGSQPGSLRPPLLAAQGEVSAPRSSGCGGAGWHFEPPARLAMAQGARSWRVAGSDLRSRSRQVLKGPDGPLKEMGQAALDKVRGAANRFSPPRCQTGTIRLAATPARAIPARLRQGVPAPDLPCQPGRSTLVEADAELVGRQDSPAQC